MRKLSLILVAACLALPFSVEAKTLDELLAEKGVVAGGGSADAGKVYYNGGTRLEFGDDFSLKMNMIIHSRYQYTQNDGGDDVSEFRIRRARLSFSGHLLNKQFSYKLQNDFVGTSDSGNADGRRTEDLRDAWIQWNLDDAAMIRMGQFKTPFGLQENTSSSALVFVERSDVSNFFIFDRQMGVMMHGGMDELGYALGLFNGDSDGEGRNRRGTDNNHNFFAHGHYNMNGYERKYEGDPMVTDDFQATFGGTFEFGQGADGNGDFDEYAFNADAAIRASGASAQAEFFFRNRDSDDIADSDLAEDEATGFYIQGGYTFVPEEWDGHVRFGYISFDDEDATDNQQEYSGVVNYYLNGHNLKLQNQITFRVTEFDDSSLDTDDIIYTLNLVGKM